MSWLLRCQLLVFPLPKGIPRLALPKVIAKIMSWLKHWNGSKEQTCCFKQTHCSCFSEIFLKLAKEINYCLRLQDTIKESLEQYCCY